MIIKAIRYPIWYFFILIIILSCGTPKESFIERGEKFTETEGTPNIRLFAYHNLADDNSNYLRYNLEILESSLIFFEKEQGGSAEFYITVTGEDTSGYLVFTDDKEIKIDRNFDLHWNSGDIYTHSGEINIDPGIYYVRANVQEKSSNKTESVTKKIKIPDNDESESYLSDVILKVKQNVGNRYKLQMIYDVPQKYDSLQFEFQIQRGTQITKLVHAKVELIEFESDTTIASPIHYINYTTSDIQYKGINYLSGKTIFEDTFEIENTQLQNRRYHFDVGKLGNYRFQITLYEDDNSTLFTGRDFSVKSRNYPFLNSVRELAEPLVYIMDEKEYEKMMVQANPDSMKYFMDRFWLSEMRQQQKAREVSELYYKRVVMANKLFSNFKAGWKTDAGMVYILFGNPWYVDKYFNRLVWLYDYSMNDPVRYFEFYRRRPPNVYYPFDHYVLNRRNDYFNQVYRQKDLWRKGFILDNLN